MLLRAEARRGNRLERVELLWRRRAARRDQARGSGARARALRARAQARSRSRRRRPAASPISLVAAKRWDDALPVLEMLARQAEGLDRLERSRREAQLGKAYEALHRTEKAARHYRLAVEADPDSLEAALGLAAVLMAEAKAHEGSEQAAEQWREVDRRYREILARHRTGIADSQVAEIWYRLGVASRALGEDKKAEASFRRALEKEPLHEATLDAMVELGGARGEWRMVADAKRAQIEALAKRDGTEDRRAKLFEEIGDIWRERLKDIANAVGAYLEGLELAPASRVLLHKLLEAYTEQRQWRRAIETLDQLSAQRDVAGAPRALPLHRRRDRARRAERRRARGRQVQRRARRRAVHAEGVRRRREAADRAARTGRTWRARTAASSSGWARTRRPSSCSSCGPSSATSASITSATPRRRPRRTRSRASSRPTTSRVTSSSRTSTSRRARRAATRRSTSCSSCSAHAPDRVELYKALASLYRAEHELDKAWCVAQALVFLGAASDEERMLYERFRPAQFTPAPRRLTEELWQKAIIHPREDRHVGAIFASTLGALAAGTAQPVTAFGLTAGRAHGSRPRPARGEPHRQVRLRRARDRPGADGVAAGAAATACASPTRSASAPSGSGSCRRCSSARRRSARTTSASSRSRSASAWRTCGPSGS